MSENERNDAGLLERIKGGEVVFGPEYEGDLKRLENLGEIEIVQKHHESVSDQRNIDRILVRIPH